LKGKEKTNGEERRTRKQEIEREAPADIRAPWCLDTGLGDHYIWAAGRAECDHDA
jgi:hypothetical protein